jgi:23S rRNA pseudouridine1911/1915/1917 synthase
MAIKSRMLDRVAKIQNDARQRPQPEEGPLTVLFEDDAVLVLDKPAGQVVHPTYKNTTGTLLNAVLWRVRARPGVQPGILTRLDKDTSGVVVIALTPELHATMQKDMAAGRVKKEYLAVVDGTPSPPRGRISLPLGRSSEDRRIVVVREDGQRCETDYEVVEVHGDVTLVRCTLITGRTHQIRVHLSASGWPIVGDAVYGRDTGRRLGRSGAEPTPGVCRQALHAWRVTFPHPVTRETISITAPLPPDVAGLVAARP